jgi:hypothetical protein
VQILNVQQAANYTCLSKSSLEKLRVDSVGSLDIEVEASVVEDRVNLDCWLTRKKVANTSQSIVIGA